MIYSTRIGALFLKYFVVRKTLRLYSFEIWVFSTVSKCLMSQFVDDFWFVWKKLDLEKLRLNEEIGEILPTKSRRFLLVLIPWNISLTDWFSKDLVNFTNFTSFSQNENNSCYWAVGKSYAVRTGTLSVFYCLILSLSTKCFSVMSEQNKNCQFAEKRRALWRTKYLIQGRNV